MNSYENVPEAGDKSLKDFRVHDQLVRRPSLIQPSGPDIQHPLADDRAPAKAVLFVCHFGEL